MISVESHLGDCPPCLRELRQMQSVGDALRLAAAPGPADD
jgi:anti-sigma factor RsiW